MQGEGRGLDGNLDASAMLREEEMAEADQRSLSRNSSQSSFSESRKSSMTKSGRKIGREERGPSGSSSSSTDSSDLREISVGREMESRTGEEETKEPEVKKEEEEGREGERTGENHLLVSCTAASYFTPAERPVTEKQAEERWEVAVPVVKKPSSSSSILTQATFQWSGIPRADVEHLLQQEVYAFEKEVREVQEMVQRRETFPTGGSSAIRNITLELDQSRIK